MDIEQIPAFSGFEMPPWLESSLSLLRAHCSCSYTAFFACFFALIVLRVACLIFFAPFVRYIDETAADVRLRPLSRDDHPCSDLPPIYPLGWYRLLDSGDVKITKPVEVSFCGDKLAVFRDATGAAVAVDATCPHLGANLARGGVVNKAGCLVCPFHGWTFDGTGRCVTVPYAPPGTKLPDAARLIPREVLERNGMILIYNGGPVGPGRPPSLRSTWSPPSIAGLAQCVLHGISDHTLSVYAPSDVPENGADSAHLGHVHAPLALLLPKALAPLKSVLCGALEHAWSITWAAGDVALREGHLAHLSVSEVVRDKLLTGWAVPGTRADVNIVQIGPGLVHWSMTSALGPIHVLASLTPRGRMRTSFRHHILAGPWVPRIMAKIIFSAAMCQVDADVPIWNSKAYAKMPLLVKGDGPVAAFRRWYTQFNPPSVDSGTARVAGQATAAASIDW